LHSRAAELRAAFDRSFAEAARADDQVSHDLIAIRVGAEPFAMRLTDVAGLFADRKVTHVPGGYPAQLGIAGFRGALVPVFSLPRLFACPAGSVPRWLAVAAVVPVALAFDGFDGHLRVPGDAILPRQAPAPRRGIAQQLAPGLAPEFIRTGDVVRPLIHLPSVIDALGATEAPPLQPAPE
jgi:purine-binding chemotaxis protein CheW